MASTEEQLRDQARQAHAAGDAAAAARFMERAREASASASSIPVSEGSTLLKQYEDGGYITQDRKTRQMQYINPNDAYVTADQGTVTSIMREGGNSHKVRKGEMSRDVVGEGFTSIASMFGKGLPFARGYVEPAMAAVNPNISEETIRNAIGSQEAELPALTGLARTATGAAAVTGSGVDRLISSPSALMRTLQGVGVGTSLGAAEGAVAGYGEGGLPEAARQAETGAQFGAAGGLVAPIAGSIAGGVARLKAEAPVLAEINKIGAKGDARRIIKDAVEADGAGAVLAASSQTPYGTTATLGPNMSNLLDAVANSQGKGAAIVRTNLGETSLGASRDLTRTIDEVLGLPTSGKTGQKIAIMADTRENRKKLYGSAYDASITPGEDASDNVLDLYTRVIPEDLTGARNLMQQEGSGFDYMVPTRVSEEQANKILAKNAGVEITYDVDGNYIAMRTPTVETLDYVTRRLHSRAQELKVSGDLEGYRSKTALAIQMRNALDEVSPDYAAARAAGKDAIDQKIAADLGTDLLSTKTTMEDVQIALEVMGPVELKQLRIALRNSIENTAANAKINPRATNSTEVVEALATLKSLNTRAVATKLRMVLGEVGFEKMSQQIANTSDAMLMEATVVAGSRTAIRQLVQKRFEEIIGPSVGEQIGQKGLIGAVTSPAVDAAVSGGSQASRISAAQEQLAPVLSRRMTPEDLMQQALAMENAAPGIARAREAGEARRSLVTGGILGGTIAQQSAGREAPFPGLSLLGPR
tara:strand:+ start:338 stop:2614 length:2277 start_codon:yes stop_codon:yes gene_type:complete